MAQCPNRSPFGFGMGPRTTLLKGRERGPKPPNPSHPCHCSHHCHLRAARLESPAVSCPGKLLPCHARLLLRAAAPRCPAMSTIPLSRQAMPGCQPRGALLAAERLPPTPTEPCRGSRAGCHLLVWQCRGRNGSKGKELEEEGKMKEKWKTRASRSSSVSCG